MEDVFSCLVTLMIHDFVAMKRCLFVSLIRQVFEKAWIKKELI